MHHIVDALGAVIIAVISSLGYAGIAALMAIELACIPLPSEVIMPFSGYLVFTGRFNLLLVATVGAIGCNIGSTAAYFVGLYGGRPFIDRYGRYVLMSPAEMGRVERFFQRYGSITVLIGRLLPVVRTFIALPAGIASMSQWRFQLYTFLGSWPWCFGLAYVGMKLGDRWNSDPALRATLHSADAIIVVAGVAAMAIYVWKMRRHMLW